MGKPGADNTANDEISINPNPSNGSFVLNLPGEEEKNVVVYDVTGKVVFEKNKTTDTTMNIDITHRAPGIYLIKVNTRNQILTKKIIKQ